MEVNPLLDCRLCGTPLAGRPTHEVHVEFSDDVPGALGVTRWAVHLSCREAFDADPVAFLGSLPE